MNLGPLGLPVSIITEDEQAELPDNTLYVMTRVVDDDPLAVPAELRRTRTKTLCDDCGEPCWLSPRSLGKTPAHIARVCLECALKRAKGMDT